MVARVRFLQKSRSAGDFATWARAEVKRNQKRLDLVSRTNGTLLLVSGLVGLSVMSLSVPPWNASRIALFAGILAWVVAGLWLIRAGRRR
jgi:uncharacterized membrane protein SirB2